MNEANKNGGKKTKECPPFWGTESAQPSSVE